MGLALGWASMTAAALWASLAIRYSNLPWEPLRLGLAIGFFTFSFWALGVARTKRSRTVFCTLFFVVLVWFASLRPSHERPWRPEVSTLPRALVNGDTVTFTGVRDFDFRSRTDFTPRYTQRTVSISHLTSMDFFISYWKMGPVGHTFVSFNFDNTEPVAISIETRPEIGENFDPIGSLFKQFELIYVVGQERDIVGSRTKHRNEEVFMYRVNIDPQALRRLFIVYIDRINSLSERAEFYHLLSNSCTVNIVRYANAAGRMGRWELDHLLNGWIDRYLYRSGRILPPEGMLFEEYREKSHINAAANAVPPQGNFSQKIRDHLP